MFLLQIQEPENGAVSPTLRLEYHIGDIPPYAILSHRWDLPADEVTFQDMVGNVEAAKQKKGYAKVEGCCMQALEYGLNYAWIDTCCIDKSSSAELSEAINSMWSWYRDAKICFAYLNDVPYDSTPRLSDPKSPLYRSAWFDRGWTLQELIAPHDVIFFSEEWGPRSLGSKSTLAEVISSITGIRKEILQDRSKLLSASIAERMSWASRRRTTRVEDEAYSLMGIFGVNMTTIYGEGSKAFIRLQEEIMRTSTDQTIFAWSEEDDSYGMLAKSPRSFKDSAKYYPMDFNDFSERFRLQESFSIKHQDGSGIVGSPDLVYSMTNFGLQISLPVVHMPERFHEYNLAFIACTYGENDESTIIFLKHRKGRPSTHFHRVCFSGMSIIHRHKEKYPLGLSLCPLWISGGDVSATLNPKPSLHQNPPCRSVQVSIMSRRPPLNDSSMTPEKLRTVCNVRPPALWHHTPNELFARLRPGEYVTLTFSESQNEDQRTSSTVFVLGLHNNQIWYSLEAGVPPRPVTVVHEEYDVLNFGQVWEEYPGNIMYLETGSPREWFVPRGGFSDVHRLYRRTPTFTESGELCQNFDMVFFR